MTSCACAGATRKQQAAFLEIAGDPAVVGGIRKGFLLKLGARVE
jgi:hypothetical protein